jgi:hypothetical protein
LQEQINYKLLVSRVEQAKNVNYYLKGGDLGVAMGQDTDQPQRLVIRDELKSE